MHAHHVRRVQGPCRLLRSRGELKPACMCTVWVSDQPQISALGTLTGLRIEHQNRGEGVGEGGKPLRTCSRQREGARGDGPLAEIPQSSWGRNLAAVLAAVDGWATARMSVTW